MKGDWGDDQWWAALFIALAIGGLMLVFGH